MSDPREDIANALFALLQAATFSAAINGSTTWLTSSRRLELWGDVPTDQQPAMFLVEHTEDDQQPGRGIPVKRYMDFAVFCYAPCVDKSIVGGTLVNLMTSAVETALAPDDVAADVLTLGYTVQWCRIEGKIFKDPGDIDGQAMIIIPVRVLLP